MKAYKIVELKDGGYYTLFHSYSLDGERTRRLPPGRWLVAEDKVVKDGTDGAYYDSGWHVLLTVDDAKEYLRRFSASRTLAIVACRVKDTGLRSKLHSTSPVFLAKEVWLNNEAEYVVTLGGSRD